MSAGPGNSSRPPSGLLARRGPLLAASVAVGATAYFFFARRPPAPEGTKAPVFSTPGIKNIEGAYSNAGATSTHTKAYGGTPMGNKDNENLREHSGAGTGQPKGFQSDSFGDDQRASDKSKVEQKFNETMYGEKKGK